MVWPGSLHSFSSWTADWSPFRLDALGLVTLLGADEIARDLGSLTRNTYTDFLPVFGAYKVAANQFATQEAGYTLFNLTDGISVTEMNGWITRWLATNLDAKLTILKMSVRDQPRKRSRRSYLALAIGLLVGLGLMALALTQADWYGLANAVAMIVATAVRNLLLDVLRDYLDGRVKKIFGTSHTKATTPASASKGDATAGPEGIVKLLIVLPDGRVAISFTQRGMIPLMLAPLDKPSEQLFYRIARAIGWLAFAIHIICIGQAYLLTQIITVFLMTLATVCTVLRFGVHREHQVASLIKIEQLELGERSTGSKNSKRTFKNWKRKYVTPDEENGHKKPSGLGRKDIYLRLDPEPGTPRQYLHTWSLFPQLGNPSSEVWLADFDLKLMQWRDDFQSSTDEAFELERRFLGQQPGYRDDL